jgi:hypothetical protein
MFPEEIERMLKFMEDNRPPADLEKLSAMLKQTDKIVATMDIEGAQFHTIGSITISNNPDKAERRVILWLNPTPLDHDWKVEEGYVDPETETDR